MKKALGVILIIVGFLLAVIIKIGPTKETKFLFGYGIWPPIVVGLVLLIVGLVLYRRK